MDLEPARVEPGEQQEVLDDIGQPESLVDQSGDFLAGFRREIFRGQELLQSGAQDGDRSLELVRGIGGKEGRTFDGRR